MTCYGDLGCFRDEGPFNYLDMLPSPPEEIGTVFYLHTRRNEEIPQVGSAPVSLICSQVLEYNNITTVHQSNFNASCTTKVIIHGFGSFLHQGVGARDAPLLPRGGECGGTAEPELTSGRL